MSKLVPCYRGAVDAWECDQMGHMNVQFYMSKGSEAFGHLQNTLGLNPERIRREKHGLRFKSLRTQYKAEVHAGSVVHGVAGIRKLDGDLIHGFIQIFETAYDRLSASYEFVAQYTDFVTDTVQALPSDIREAVIKLADEHTTLYKPAPFFGAMMPARPLNQMFESSRSAVDLWECDSFGYAEYRYVVGYFSDAASHIIAAVGLTRGRIRDRNLGSAALDYYTEFHAPIRKSMPVLLKSGLMQAEGKLFRFGHHLINLDNDEIVASTTVLGCYFDMTSRKSVPLPSEYSNYPAEKMLTAQL